MLLKILSKRPMINEIADWRGNASSFNRRKTVPNAADQSEEDSLFPGSPVNAMVAEDVRGHRSSIYPLIPWMRAGPTFRLKLTYQASHSSKVKTHKVNNAPRYARFVQRSIRSSPPPVLILQRATKTGRGNRRQGAAGYHRSYLVIKIIVR